MISMGFTVCLVWHRDDGKLAPIVTADPGIAFETVVSALRGCGLKTGVYKISDRMSKGGEGLHPLFLKPDMDGNMSLILRFQSNRERIKCRDLRFLCWGTKS